MGKGSTKKHMKASAIKTIVVSLTADTVFEFEVNTELFDDPFMEAATRAVEKIKTSKGAIVSSTSKCWEKKTPKKAIRLNSYWVLINAGCYLKAEQLREKFKMQYNKDLAAMPMRALCDDE